MLAILKQADEAGLVLQPSNTKKPKVICACCGDCCGVFRLVKTQRKPSSYVSSPYIVAHDDAICSGCGTCVDRCQMEDIKVLNNVAEVNLDRCIGCGLCVSTCTTRAMSLVRKPDSEQRFIPDSLQATTIQLGQARGVLSNTDQMSMLIKSKIDRLVARI
jgi:Na+-translocating ferredoxin:NAD+ oxidoreductase RNF subunit RnfB